MNNFLYYHILQSRIHLYLKRENHNQKKPMKHVLLLAASFLLFGSSFAQLVEISVEPYVIHDGSIAELDGMTTYHVFAMCTNPADEISAVYGDATAPLSLTSTLGFYQNSLGNNEGWQVNPAFFGAFPAIEYDSWITIGAMNVNEASGSNNTVGLTDAFNSFSAGGDFIVNSDNGGSWFTLFGDPVAQAGDDLKVLIAQLTVENDAVITGNFNIQIFVNGEQSESVLYESIPFSSSEGAVFGCMDPEAINYNPDATEAGEVCIFPCSLNLSVAEIVQNTCPGVADGAISVDAEGAQLGVLFGIDGETPASAVGSFDDLSGGVYTISAIDGAGCETSIEVEIVAPEAVVISAAMTESVSCNGGSDAVISGSSSGGSGAMNYSLSSTFEDSSSELYFDNLGSGLYTVYAMDENGCVAESGGISIANPQALTISVAGGQSGIAPATCSDSEDGVVSLITIGGSGTSAGMQYSADGINFSPGNILNIGGGTYTFYAMDVNGCIASSANEYTVEAPDAIVITGNASGISCNGDQNGAVSFDATGGNGGLMFSFNGEDADGSNSFGDLLPGDYIVLVTDMEGCTSETTFTVDDISAVEATATSTAVSCNGDTDGLVEVGASGGTSLFEYSSDGSDFGSSPMFTEIAPGSYTFYVQDSNGCQASVEVTVEEPEALSVTGVLTNDSGAGDGELDITVAGGNGGNTFAWEGPDNFTSADEDLTGLFAGEYSVTVTDANGCSITEVFGLPLGVDEYSFLQDVVVSPNPSFGMYNLAIFSANGEAIVLNVYDAQARVVWSQTINQAWGSMQAAIDLTGMAAGAYQLELSSNEARHTVQLLKQ